MKPTVFSLPWDIDAEYQFIPLCCAHYPIGDMDLLKAWVEQIRTNPKAFTILCGDQFDFARTHYRKHVRKYGEDGNSQVAIDAMHKKEVEAFAKMLLPIKDKIVGLISGNHKWEFASGLTNDQLLCELVGIPFLGAMAFFRVEFREKRGKQKTSLSIFAHHHGGCKGSGSHGGDATSLEKIQKGFEADIYVAGHTHRRHSFKQPKLALPTRGIPVPRERTKVYIRAGALLKGYEPDAPSAKEAYCPSYAEEAALAPTDLGTVTCKISFENKTIGGTHFVYPKYKIEF